MKLHILNDLHIEFEDFHIPETDADVIILAGDIHVGEKGVKWALETIKDKQVIYVMGNHEYYREALPDLTKKLKKLTEGTHVHVLENNVFEMDKVVFLGCTLWSDFQLLNDPEKAVITAQRMMNDFKLIKVSSKQRNLRASDTAIWHVLSKSWIEKKLQGFKQDTVKTVVVSHHAPSILSVPERFKTHPLSSAFASQMDTFISDSTIDLWVHGHIHDSSDYTINNTRILCNPRGYPHEPNTSFIPDLTVEI